MLRVLLALLAIPLVACTGDGCPPEVPNGDECQQNGVRCVYTTVTCSCDSTLHFVCGTGIDFGPAPPGGEDLGVP